MCLCWNDLTKTEREKYINQDYVKQTEKVLDRGFCENRSLEESWNIDFDKMNSKTMKSLIVEMFKDGKSVNDIAYHLPCNKHWIFTIIKEVKNCVPQ